MAINWNATVLSVQAALDGITNGPLTQAELNSGVAAREALKTAGAAYDTMSTDGVKNVSPYALSVQSWAALAQPAWVEADRVARAIYGIVPSPSQYAKAAFGLSGVRPWSASTSYSGPGGTPVGVVPTSATGYTYFGSPGVSGTTEPGWPTTLGQYVYDGTIIWTCAAVASGSGSPIPLPWDITQQTVLTLNVRSSAATYASTGPIYGGLQGLNASTFAAWTAILATKPASDPIQDAASLSANQTLTTAIQSANAWIAVTAVK